MQKCDAKRPCTRCTIAKTTTECVYGDKRNLNPVDSPSLYNAEDYLGGEVFLGTHTSVCGFSYIISPVHRRANTTPDCLGETYTVLHRRSSRGVHGYPPERLVKSASRTPTFALLFFLVR